MPMREEDITLDDLNKLAGGLLEQFVPLLNRVTSMTNEKSAPFVQHELTAAQDRFIDGLLRFQRALGFVAGQNQEAP